MARNGPRRNLRLPGRDYSADGAYFVTIRGRGPADLFGRIVRGEMQLNEVGRIVGNAWQGLAHRHSYVTIDEWCIMPDHFHGILVLRADATAVGVQEDGEWEARIAGSQSAG
jgi:putative transposase